MFILKQNIYLTKGLQRATLFDGDTGAVYWLSPAASRDISHVLEGPGDGPYSPGETDLLSRLTALGLCGHTTPDASLPGRETGDDALRRGMSMVYYEVTGACNMSCLHCYAGSSASDGPQIIPSAGASQKDSELFDEIAASGVRRIQFIGGEPFFDWERLEGLCTLARGRFDQVEIATNGTVMNDRMIAFIKANSIKLSVSLYSHLASVHDSITCSPGSHSLTLSHLFKLKEAGVDFYIACVSMDRNSPDIKGTIDFIRHHFGMTIKPKPLRLTGRAAVGFVDKEGLEKRRITLSSFTGTFEREDFLSNMHFHNCYGRGPYIGHDGKIYPCVMERRFSIGDITANSWAEILAGEAFRDAIRLTKDRIEGCRDCEFRYLCFDCRPDASALHPDLFGKPWNCTYSPEDGRWMSPQKPGIDVPIRKLTRTRQT
jgi:radical SAM protein with 4Fe4S-binding SPASM domain